MNKQYREQMINDNLGLVYKLANKYAGKSNSLTVEDAISHGTIGLIKAVDAFNPKRNIKFSTFAFYKIYYEIRDYVVTMSGPLHQNHNHFSNGTLKYGVPIQFSNDKDHNHEYNAIDNSHAPDDFSALTAKNDIIDNIELKHLIEKLEYFRENLCDNKHVMDYIMSEPSKSRKNGVVRSNKVYATKAYEMRKVLRKYIKKECYAKR